jgi:glycerol kinase
VLDPYFSASKFHWLSEHVPEARDALRGGFLRLGGTDSFVIHQLTGGALHTTDPGTASRTALFDIREVAWDSDLLDAFAVTPACLPEVWPTCGPLGVIRHPDIAASGVEITADAVDAHAALFAQGCFDSKSAKATLGTGAFIEVNTGQSLIEPDGKLPVFIAWQIDEAVDYTIEGGVFSVGSAIEWAARTGLVTSAPETAALAETVSDGGGILFMPSFVGLAAPHWLSSTRAMISGIGLDTTRAHIARALLDGIAFACSEVVMALNARLGGTLSRIKADGGPSRNRYLMQRLADLIGLPVEVSEEPEMTALGAALLAAVGARQMTIPDVASLLRRTMLYEPQASADQRAWSWRQWYRGVDAIRRLAAE